MQTGSRIYIAGHNGLVGSALLRALRAHGYENLIVATRSEVDLTDSATTEGLFREFRPEYVFVAAAKVGGILANKSQPADFIRINLQIETNIIDCAYRFGVEKLLFLGSSCIYPRQCPQPIREEYLLQGDLEPTNEAYAVAKIAGIYLCRSYNRQYGTNFLCAMPTNLYGPGDNFDLESSHVLPALIRKFHDALLSRSECVELWGTGKPRREFMHVDDLADALVFLMLNYEAKGDQPIHINVGTGKDISIRELADIVANIVGYRGRLAWNTEMPDGTPRKLLDISRLKALGWNGARRFKEGIRDTYDWFLKNCTAAAEQRPRR